MRERDTIVPRIVHVHIIVVREQTELYGHEEDLDELDDEFVGETPFRLPLLDRIHEEEAQFTAHLLLRERARVAICQVRMILPATRAYAFAGIASCIFGEENFILFYFIELKKIFF